MEAELIVSQWVSDSYKKISNWGFRQLSLISLGCGKAVVTYPVYKWLLSLRFQVEDVDVSRLKEVRTKVSKRESNNSQAATSIHL